MNRGNLFTQVTLAAMLLGATLTLPAMAQDVPVLQDLKPGSFLVFPKFYYDPQAGVNTQIRISNTSHDFAVRVRLNFVCPGVKRMDDFCDALDIHRSITAHGTVIIDVGNVHPPGPKGFAVAIAEDSSKRPLAFDHLIGSYHISSGGNVEAAQAVAIQSVHDVNTVLGE